jgi:hypothetical protein
LLHPLIKWIAINVVKILNIYIIPITNIPITNVVVYIENTASSVYCARIEKAAIVAVFSIDSESSGYHDTPTSVVGLNVLFVA